MGIRRILYASQVDIGRGDGRGVNEREFVETLVARFGKDATLVIPQPSTRVPALEGANLRPISAASGSAISFGFQEIIFARALQRAIREVRQDFLVLRAGSFPLGAVLALRGTRVPFAVKTAGDGRFSALYSHRRMAGLLGPINEALFGNLLRKAGAVDAVSLRHVDSLQRRYALDPGRLHHVDNAVNTRRFHPGDRARARKSAGLDRFEQVVGYTGNFAADRGGLQLLRVAPWLLDRFPNLGFVILGGHVDDLRAKAATAGLGDRFVFPGSVPFAKVPVYVQALNVGVSFLPPEKRGSSEQKVRQYVATGVPSVVSPGASAFVEEQGIGTVVESTDLQGIRIAVAEWIRRSEQGGEALQRTIARYAERQLSVERALDRRLAIWTKALEASGFVSPTEEEVGGG